MVSSHKSTLLCQLLNVMLLLLMISTVSVAEFQVPPVVKELYNRSINIFRFLYYFVPAYTTAQLFKSKLITSKLGDLSAVLETKVPLTHFLLLLHGLNSNEGLLNHFALAAQNDPSILVWAPRLLDLGNVGLDDSIAALWKQLAANRSQWENLPMTIVGYSNGGRLSAALDVKLRREGHVPSRHLHLICPPVAGTTTVKLKRFNVKRIKPVVFEELTPGSATCTTLKTEFWTVPNTSGLSPASVFVYLSHRDLFVQPISLIRSFFEDPLAIGSKPVSADEESGFGARLKVAFRSFVALFSIVRPLPPPAAKEPKRPLLAPASPLSSTAFNGSFNWINMRFNTVHDAFGSIAMHVPFNWL